MTCPQSSMYLFYGTSVTFYICLSAIETYIFTSFLKKKKWCFFHPLGFRFCEVKTSICFCSSLCLCCAWHKIDTQWSLNRQTNKYLGWDKSWQLELYDLFCLFWEIENYSFFGVLLGGWSAQKYSPLLHFWSLCLLYAKHKLKTLSVWAQVKVLAKKSWMNSFFFRVEPALAGPAPSSSRMVKQ